jgi:hypothetical protein
MRSLKDICEASLLDIEGTIEKGDTINDQLEKLKAIACNKDNYVAVNGAGLIELKIENIKDFKDLFEIVYPKKIKSLSFCIKKRSIMRNHDWNDIWIFETIINNKRTRTEIPAKGVSSKILFSKYINTFFENLETLKQLITNDVLL